MLERIAIGLCIIVIFTATKKFIVGGGKAAAKKIGREVPSVVITNGLDTGVSKQYSNTDVTVNLAQYRMQLSDLASYLDKKAKNYHELEALFNRASDLEESTRKRYERDLERWQWVIARKQRVAALMERKQYSPLTIGEVAISWIAINEGFFDDVPVSQVVDFERELHAYMHSKQALLLAQVNRTPEYINQERMKFKAAFEDFKENHQTLTLESE